MTNEEITRFRASAIRTELAEQRELQRRAAMFDELVAALKETTGYLVIWSVGERDTGDRTTAVIEAATDLLAKATTTQGD
jgi:hypothetical protein